MEKVFMEPVTHHYCDICEEEIGLPRYGRDGIVTGNCCIHLWREADKQARIRFLIKEQPFF